MRKKIFITALIFSVVMMTGCKGDNTDINSSETEPATVTENTSVTVHTSAKESQPETVTNINTKPDVTINKTDVSTANEDKAENDITEPVYIDQSKPVSENDQTKPASSINKDPDVIELPIVPLD